MKDNPLLYVKSEKIPIIKHTEGVSGHPCTGAFRAAETILNYKPEDQKAIDIVKEARIGCRLIDLANCSFALQLRAKMSGINETPTLVLHDRKIKGIENIRQVLDEVKT